MCRFKIYSAENEKYIKKKQKNFMFTLTTIQHFKNFV